jgi:hypothetical protein
MEESGLRYSAGNKISGDEAHFTTRKMYALLTERPEWIPFVSKACLSLS